MTSDEARLAAVADLIEVLESNRRYLSRAAADMRIFASAGLARCRRLLMAMQLQVDDELDDTIGAQARAVFEIVINGLWLLYQTDAAYVSLRHEQIESSEKLIRLGKMDVDLQVPPGWDGIEPETLDISARATRVGQLLEAAGAEGERARLEFAYNVLYRGESHMGSHGGLGALIGHLDPKSTHTDVLETRQAPERTGTVGLIMAASLTVVLGGHVYMAFGISVEDITELAITIGNVEIAAD